MPVASHSTVATKIFVTPKDKDVRCGRGLANYQHPGNQLLRNKIFASLEEFKKIGKKRRKEKSLLIRRVAEFIREEGGRFLKFDYVAKQWYDGGMPAAKLRVGIAFRDACTPKKVKYIEAMNKKENDISGDSSMSSEEETPVFESIARFDTSVDKLDAMPALQNVANNDNPLTRLKHVKPEPSRSMEAYQDKDNFDFTSQSVTSDDDDDIEEEDLVDFVSHLLAVATAEIASNYCMRGLEV